MKGKLFDTIEHLYHWRHFISECIRVLKRDGVYSLRRRLTEDFDLSVESVYRDDAPSILFICGLR